MINKDEILEIVQTLNKNKFRAFLTAFGVFWGIFMLLLLLGTGDGLERGVTNMFRGYDLNSFHIFSKSTRIPFEGVKENRMIRMTEDDLINIRKKFGKELTFLGARSYYTNKEIIVKHNQDYDRYDIYGADPEMYEIRKIHLISGRYTNQRDEEEGRFNAIIGKEILQELNYSVDSVIGDFIQIHDSFFKIVGVFESIQIGEEANYQNKTIFVPHKTFQNIFNRNNTIDNIAVVSKNPNAEIEILAFLKRRHKVHPDDEALFVWNTKKEFSKFQDLFSAINIFVWIIGIGTLLSGVVGVSNIMVISIYERTKEIGIRKAVGATPFSIIKMILIESIFLTGISGYLGLSVGLIFLELVNYLLNIFNLKSQFFLDPQINLLAVITSILSLLIAGFFAAFLPARKAALIKPVEALME